jgi:hypothetical protein
MALANRTDLKASLASWLMRDDLTAQLDDFIVLCESRNNKRLRTRDMVSTTTLTAGGDGSFTLPTDFIEVYLPRSNVSPISTLSSVSPDLAALYPTASYPYYYNIKGNSLIVSPPNTSSITFSYYATIPALTASNATNWLLTKAPEVYLWGSLLQSAPFLEDDNRIITWGNLYEAAVTELTKVDQRAVYGRTIARIRGFTP